MRHLSLPWYAENVPGGFVVRNAERKPVAHVYGHDRPRQIEGHPSLLTIDEAREMALLIVKLAGLLQGKDKVSQDSEQHPPLSAGKVAKRSRFDATPPPHSIPVHPPIPVLNGRKRQELASQSRPASP
jgi:hypothetical protein